MSRIVFTQATVYGEEADVLTFQNEHQRDYAFVFYEAVKVLSTRSAEDNSVMFHIRDSDVKIDIPLVDSCLHDDSLRLLPSLVHPDDFNDYYLKQLSSTRLRLLWVRTDDWRIDEIVILSLVYPQLDFVIHNWIGGYGLYSALAYRNGEQLESLTLTSDKWLIDSFPPDFVEEDIVIKVHSKIHDSLAEEPLGLGMLMPDLGLLDEEIFHEHKCSPAEDQWNLQRKMMFRKSAP